MFCVIIIAGEYQHNLENHIHGIYNNFFLETKKRIKPKPVVNKLKMISYLNDKVRAHRYLVTSLSGDIAY